MKMQKEPVTSAKAVVGYAEFEQFDTVAEAVGHLGEEAVVKLINTQHGTNEKNRIRAEATGKPSRKSLEEKAWARITVEQLQAAAGDPAKMRALLDATVQVIEKELEAERAKAREAAAAAGSDDNGSEE